MLATRVCLRVVALVCMAYSIAPAQSPSASAQTPRRLKWVRARIRLVDGNWATGLPFIRIQIKGQSFGFSRSHSFPYEAWADTAVDGTANFHLQPGSYTAKIFAQDYVPAWGSSSTPTIDLTAEPVPDSIELKVVFYRPADISGRVLDVDSGTPLSNIRVFAIFCDFIRGMRRLARAASAMTDRDGKFSISDLPPGDYVLELTGVTPEPVTTAKNPPPDNGYGTALWPGGNENPDPFQMQSGIHEDIGVIQLHSTALRRLSLSVKSGSCDRGLPYTATLLQKTNTTSLSQGEFAFFCNDGLTLGGITPGLYVIVLTQRGNIHSAHASDVRESGFESADLVRKNAKVAITVTGPLTIRGQAMIEQPASELTPEKVPPFTLRLSATADRNSADLPHFDSLVEDGTFTGHVMVDPGSRARIALVGMPHDLALEKVIYNLATYSEPTFPLNTATDQHDLTLVLSHKVSNIRGKIAGEAGTDMSEVHVLAIPWPVEDENDYPVLMNEVSAGSDGTFQFAGLLSGCYKFVAVSAADRPKLEAPGKLLQVAGSEDTVNVPQGTFTAPTLKVISF